MAWQFLVAVEPTLKLNESSVTFKKTGDIEIMAGRHWLQHSDLVLVNSPRDFESSAIKYYAMGPDVFNRFNAFQTVLNLLAEAEQRVLTIIDPQIKSVTEEKLRKLRLEVALLHQTLDRTSQLREDENTYIEGKLNQIASNLIHFRHNIRAFVGSTSEEILTEYLHKIPGIQVTKVEKVDKPVQVLSEDEKDTIELESDDPEVTEAITAVLES